MIDLQIGRAPASAIATAVGIGMDYQYATLRFLRRCEIPLVNASAFALPFKGESSNCVISQQVIEHIPFDESLFSEMRRVLRAGGRIIEPIYGFLMSGGLFSFRHFKVPANLARQKVVDFAMPRNRRGFASSAIHIDCVTASLAQGDSAMTLQMTEQVAALHRS
jgi:SAM-dependent methyltransferase